MVKSQIVTNGGSFGIVIFSLGMNALGKLAVVVSILCFAMHRLSRFLAVTCEN